MGMATESTTAASIRVVADAAHSLHERARISGPDFEEVAPVVKNLETVLKHLRVEAEDPDSLLNTQQQETSVYARQLTPIIEDCDFTLKQLSTIFEKFGHSDDARNSNGPAPYHPVPPPFTSSSASSSSSHHPSKDGADGQGKDMIALIRTKLANQRSNLEMFLDTVQLHNPAKQRMPPPITGDQMEKIKDKVDEVAGRLFRRARRGGEDDEDLWRQFCHELEKEGFASQVLRQNKEVIRAYLRGLDSNGMLDGTGPPPSVRGILPSAAVHPSAYSPHPPATGDTSPKEVMHPTFENEKYAISVKQGRVLPAQGDQNRQLQQQHLVPHAPPPPPGLYNQDSALSYDRYTSSDDEYGPDSSHQLALISTWELLTLDKQEQDHLAARMGAMHLAPQPLLPGPTASPGTSPNQRYLPAPVPSKQSHLLPPVAPPLDLSISPRYVPPLPAYSAALTPPPAYGSSPVVPQPLPSSFPGVGHAVTPDQARYSRLAPDSQGRDIPLDAKWTKIKRSLVSTEVLAQAGVRYEARPEFVAVLGVLTKADIAEFARRSAEVRRMRMRGPGRQQTRSAHAPRTRHRTGSTSDSESDVLWDESDSSEDERDVKRRYDRGKYIPKPVKGDKGPAEEQKGTKVYPFIVSPPNGENKASPSATVKPKPILKNKNENHVRFDRDGPIEIPPESERSPRSSRDEMDRERRQRHRDYDRDYDRDNERERDRRRRRDRDRDREREYPLRSSRHRREERDRERERDRDRPGKKKWGETLGAVGIGGAAASLLSVLTEAASGF